MNLTIYKLKSTITDPRNALAVKTHLEELSTEDVFLKLWIERPQLKPPQWVTFFQNKFSDISALNNSYSGAVLFVNTDSGESPTWFAIPFGSTWMRLQDEAIDVEFGMQAALNLIDSAQLRTLDTRRLEDGALQEKKSHSKRARIGDFEIDVDRILLSSISGKVKDPTFATMAIGGDGLKLASPQTFSNVREFCQELQTRVTSRAFQEDYPWYGKVGRIKDQEMLVRLDQILIQEINKAQPDRLYLAAPDTLDESLIFSYKLCGAGTTDPLADMDFGKVHQQLLNRFKMTAKLSDFQKLAFVARNDDGGILKRWKLKKCLLFEQELDGKYYLLSRGEWFEVNRKFKQQVDTRFEEIVENSKAFIVPLLACSKSRDREKRKDSEDTFLSEGAYNRRVCDTQGHMLFDKRPILAEGQYTQIEFCDFAVTGEHMTTLCHVKVQSNEYSSQTLSALFLQGYVSGVTLRESRNFRRKLKEKHGIFSEDKVDTSKVHHKFVVVTDQRSGHVPFFSKISLSKTMGLLDGLGYGTSIQWVPIED